MTNLHTLDRVAVYGSLFLCSGIFLTIDAPCHLTLLGDSVESSLSGPCQLHTDSGVSQYSRLGYGQDEIFCQIFRGTSWLLREWLATCEGIVHAKIQTTRNSDVGKHPPQQTRVVHQMTKTSEVPQSRILSLLIGIGLREEYAGNYASRSPTRSILTPMIKGTRVVSV